MDVYGKARGAVEMGVCWPGFGGVRMIRMHLLEFERVWLLFLLCLLLCVYLSTRLGGGA